MIQTLVRVNRIAPRAARRRRRQRSRSIGRLARSSSLAADVEVVAIAEAARRFSLAGLPSASAHGRRRSAAHSRGARMAARLRPLLTFGSVALEVHGSDRVVGVTLARIDADGRPVPGSERRIAADAACLGYRLHRLERARARLGRRHQPGPPGTGLRAIRDTSGRSSVGGVIVGDGAGMGGRCGGDRRGHDQRAQPRRRTSAMPRATSGAGSGCAMQHMARWAVRSAGSSSRALDVSSGAAADFAETGGVPTPPVLPVRGTSPSGRFGARSPAVTARHRQPEATTGAGRHGPLPRPGCCGALLQELIVAGRRSPSWAKLSPLARLPRLRCRTVSSPRSSLRE